MDWVTRQGLKKKNTLVALNLFDPPIERNGNFGDRVRFYVEPYK
jgi:hypothetical protein